MSKNKLLGLIVAGLLTLPLINCTPVSAKKAASPTIKNKVAAPQKKTIKKVFMWKVVAPDGKSAYLVGSIHMVPPSFFPLPAVMEKEFSEADTLVLEVDESKLDPQHVQTYAVKKGMYLDGGTLIDNVGKDTAEALKKWLATADPMTAMAVSKMKPWLAGMQVAASELVKRGFDPKHGIDKHFLAAAKAQKKTVEELESADFQMTLLSSLPEELAEAWLRSSLLEVEKSDSEIDNLVNSWKNGDPVALDHLLTSDEKKYPELRPLMALLLYDRNPAMADKIEGYLKSGKKYFVVVGAGHLVGQKGLVEILKERKYDVQQVSDAN